MKPSKEQPTEGVSSEALTGRERPPSSQPGPRETKEQEDLERERSELENVSRRQDIEERKKYATRIYTLLCWWLGGLFIVLGLQGWQIETGFGLSEKVLITFVTGTTLNVIGIFLVVANYLFPKR